MGMHGTGGMQSDFLMSGYADTCWKNIRAFFLRKVLTFFYEHSVELVNWERNLIFLIFHLLVNNQKKDEMGLVPDGQGKKKISRQLLSGAGYDHLMSAGALFQNWIFLHQDIVWRVRYERWI